MSSNLPKGQKQVLIRLYECEHVPQDLPEPPLGPFDCSFYAPAGISPVPRFLIGAILSYQVQMKPEPLSCLQQRLKSLELKP